MPTLSAMNLFPFAHGSIEGVGDLWNGLLHPLRSASHLLVLLALGLFAGQRRRFKRAVIVFLVATLAGLLCTTLPGVPEAPAFLPSLISACTGILVALRRPFPLAVEYTLFGLAGCVLGLDSAPDGATGWVLFKILLGVWVGLSVLLLNLTNYAAMCPRKPWMKIAFRVLGSWIAAVSVLGLALSLKR